MFPSYEVTEDGFESQLQVNYLGHFLLTNLLMPRLITAGKLNRASRVINVSSIAQYGYSSKTIDFSNINSTYVFFMYTYTFCYILYV